MNKKKIFICGRVYEISTDEKAKIEKKLQKRLDSMCSNVWETEERLITAHIEIDETLDAVIFKFDRSHPWHAQCGRNPEYIHKLDACFLAGIDGKFKLPVPWDDRLLKPYLPGTFLIPLFEWVHCYIKSGEKLGVSKVTGMELNVTEVDITLSIKVDDI